MSFQDYTTFMQQVDEELIAKTGQDSKSLPDWDWFDFYDSNNRDGESARADYAVEAFFEEAEISTEEATGGY